MRPTYIGLLKVYLKMCPYFSSHFISNTYILGKFLFVCFKSTSIPHFRPTYTIPCQDLQYKFKFKNNLKSNFEEIIQFCIWKPKTFCVWQSCGKPFVELNWNISFVLTLICISAALSLSQFYSVILPCRSFL